MNSKGYTLLEALISMSLFLVLVVPLILHMSNSAKTNKGKEKLTAICLLEQETTHLRLFPNDIFTSKRRTTGNCEWEIKASFEGSNLKKYHLKAFKKKRLIEQIVFYVYKD